jgi:hypothetical protein
MLPHIVPTLNAKPSSWQMRTLVSLQRCIAPVRGTIRHHVDKGSSPSINVTPNGTQKTTQYMVLLPCAQQVVDELSSDETPQRLKTYGIWYITPPERLGVTYNWNLVKHPPLRRTAPCSCVQCSRLLTCMKASCHDCGTWGASPDGTTMRWRHAHMRFASHLAGVSGLAGHRPRVPVLRQQRCAGAGWRHRCARRGHGPRGCAACCLVVTHPAAAQVRGSSRGARLPCHDSEVCRAPASRRA